MVRYLSILITICSLTACVEQQQSPSTLKPFSSSRFSVVEYNKRVKAFLDERPETAGLSSYRAIFLNTEGCSACANGALSGIKKFLRETHEQVFVYTNDSTFKMLIPDNPKVALIVLKSEDFKSRTIFHKEMMLYSADNNNLTSTYLDLKRRDSLNSLR